MSNQAADTSASRQAQEQAQASGSGCCAPQAPAGNDSLQNQDIHSVVRDKYGQLAREGSSCCGTTTASMQQLGYSDEQKSGLPEGADLGLGCGNPLAHGAVQPGETVLDLGSGAGIDAFIAAKEVGPTGRVLGVDMTTDMLERARENARKIDCKNVEFRLGEIEHLPVSDSSVDLIISNCVINLSPDKRQVFDEALRVLRPGGRVVVSDIVLAKPLPEDVAQSVSAYVGCVAGASLRDDYLQLLRDSGFERVEVVEETGYACADDTMVQFGFTRDAAESVLSVKVRAYKPQA